MLRIKFKYIWERLCTIFCSSLPYQLEVPHWHKWYICSHKIRVPANPMRSQLRNMLIPGVNGTIEAYMCVHMYAIDVFWGFREHVHIGMRIWVVASTAKEHKEHFKVSRGDQIWCVLPRKLSRILSMSSSWPCWIAASVCTLVGLQGCQSCVAIAAAPRRRNHSNLLLFHNSDLQDTNRSFNCSVCKIKTERS